MGLLDRLDLLIRSEFNNRDRSRSSDDTLAELEGALRQSRKRMADVFRDERRLEEQVDVCLKEEQRWEDRATDALRANNESLAREALVEQQHVAARRRRIQDELRQHQGYIADLERALEALEHKIEAVRARKRVEREQGRAQEARGEERRDSSSARSTEPRRAPRSYTPSVSEDQRRWEAMLQRSRERVREQHRGGRDPIARTRESSFSAETGALGQLDAKLEEFSRFEEKIERLEAKAEATRELDSRWGAGSVGASSMRFDEPLHLDEDDPLFDPQLAALEQRFRELERDQQMNRLKKRAKDEDE